MVIDTVKVGPWAYVFDFYLRKKTVQYVCCNDGMLLTLGRTGTDNSDQDVVTSMIFPSLSLRVAQSSSF